MIELDRFSSPLGSPTVSTVSFESLTEPSILPTAFVAAPARRWYLLVEYTNAIVGLGLLSIPFSFKVHGPT